MSKKIPDGEILDTTSKAPSGKEMLYGNFEELPTEIKNRYNKENLNEKKGESI